MAPASTIWIGERLRDYSQRLRRDAEELVNAARVARRRAKIAVAHSRGKNKRIAPPNKER